MNSATLRRSPIPILACAVVVLPPAMGARATFAPARRRAVFGLARAVAADKEL